MLETILWELRNIFEAIRANIWWLAGLFLIIGVVFIAVAYVSESQSPSQTTKSGGRRPRRQPAISRRQPKCTLLRTQTASKDRVKDLKKHPRTKSEALAIDILEKLTGVSFPTVNPDWLRVSENGGPSHTIELDGYNADIGVALEFSGPLHTKWSPSVEPYDAYLRRVMLDKAKIELCERHSVCLIVIDMTLPRTHWRNYIASRLQDCGKLPKDRAIYFQYVDPQTAVPYRDEILERDVRVDISW